MVTQEDSDGGGNKEYYTFCFIRTANRDSLMRAHFFANEH